MYRTHDEPNLIPERFLQFLQIISNQIVLSTFPTGWGQPEIEKTEMKSEKEWFSVLVFRIFLSYMVLFICLFLLPWRLAIAFCLALAIISVLMNICKCCVKKNASDTKTGTKNRTRTGTRNRTGPGNGTTGNFDEFILYDSNGRSVLERSNLPSSTHIRTNNYAIPTISRPILDDLFQPSNSVGANAPSAPPLEGPLFLPSYDEVINQPNYEDEEEPPPTYDEVVLKIDI